MAWAYTLGDLASLVGAEARDADTRVSGVSTDTRTVKPDEIFFALRGPNHNGGAYAKTAFERGAAAAVVDAIPTDLPNEHHARCVVVADPLDALQRFAAAHRDRHPIPMFAITGSCGKTTAKDMTAAVLSAKYNVVKTTGNLNNEIGCPLTLLAIDADTTFAVVEMGANHVGEIANLCKIAKPNESAVTIVAPAHVEGFGSIERVELAKGEIAEGLPRDGCFYVNTDDPACIRIANRFHGFKYPFGTAGEVQINNIALADDGEMLLDIDPVGTLKLPLHVPAHATNAMLAISVGLRHGVSEFEGPLRDAAAASTRFKVLSVGPLTVLDDTYNANPASVRAAFHAMASRRVDGKRMAALGSMRELGADAARMHRETGALAVEAGAPYVFAFAEHAADFVDGARGAGAERAAAYETHDALADAVAAMAKPGDCLLVKGSRGVTMERVIALLQERYAGSPSETET